MFDYETLRVIWWLLMGIVLIGFAVMDGFDLGAGAFVRVLAHDDDERRALIETFEPFWEGNQVWFILGGGAVFAAWPYLYAASFSGFYFAILLRAARVDRAARVARFPQQVRRSRAGVPSGMGCSRSPASCPRCSSASRSAIFSSACRCATTTRCASRYEGGLIGLLRPFALLAGLVSLTMILMHGATYLALKADAVIAATRAARAEPARAALRRCSTSPPARGWPSA